MIWGGGLLCYNHPMSVEIIYPSMLPKMTPEERAESQRLIAEARAAGHPLAPYAGALPEDELTEEWLAAIRNYRRQAEEDPDF